jgi:formylglycine-generating enzyme required for sulfatase activity
MHPYTKRRRGPWELPGTWCVGSFKPNAFGLHDMAGHVLCRTQDRWNMSYLGAPSDGSAWQSGSGRIARGGCWNYIPSGLRSASRGGANTDGSALVGFRVARTAAG